MPKVVVRFYRLGTRIPVLDWLDRADARTRHRARLAIVHLSQMGHELRRPMSATLRDGIHELRFRVGAVNHRILYFFMERSAVVLSHHFTKQVARVPELEIQRAVLHRSQVLAAPRHFLHEETNADPA